MKKMVRWYNTLKAQNIEIVLPDMESDEEDTDEESTKA
jgi:hypothetical protein